MPLPSPIDKGDEIGFIDRCMSNGKMNEEYPDEKQRYAICQNQWSTNMSKEISMEIMAPGTWNGLPFSKDRLKKIVDNFKKLADIHSVPLKIGHDDKEEQLKSSSKEQHALGWANEIWLTAAGKLMAKFTDVPDIVHKAITNKLYRKVSVELDMGVSHKGEDIGDVLSGVALLGAEIPAVNTLEDLQAFLSAQSGTIAGATRQVFTTITTNYQSKEVNEMSGQALKDLQEKIAELSRTLEEQGKKQTDLEAKNTQLKAEKAEFERKEKERVDLEKKEKVKLARDNVTKVLEEAVKQQFLTPAQRENFHKMFSVDDDEAVTKIDLELLKSAIGSGKKFSVGETAHSGGMVEEDEMTIDEKVNEKVIEIMSKEGIKNYTAAMTRLFQRDHKLAMEYRDANGVKES